MGKHDFIVKALASLKEGGLYDTIRTLLSAVHARREPDFALGESALVGRELGVIGR
jgi:hypothetical protein